MLKALATLCVRNESLHIRNCLQNLLEDGIDVVLIDNDSTDDTVSIAQRFLGHGLLRIERLPWKGHMALADMLEAEHRVAREATHDWIIHVDADEWLCSPAEGETLLDGIRRADASGANCINFSEFVFIPSEGESHEGTDYVRGMLHYYFFQPCRPRLMRAWKREAGLDNRNGGGHILLGGDRKLFASDFIMRHYIALSSGQMRAKYLNRRFCEHELKRGWHSNRAVITEENMQFPQPAELHRLPRWDAKDFVTSRPRLTHYWEWRSASSAEEPASTLEAPAPHSLQGPLLRAQRASWIGASTYERAPGLTLLDEDALSAQADAPHGAGGFLARVVPRDERLGLRFDLAGKSVAIVGNGLVRHCGPQIDAHDEVLRLNGLRNWHQDPQHDGARATTWTGHPIFAVSRDASGALQASPQFERLVDAGAGLWALSPLHISVDAFRWLESRRALDRLLVAPSFAVIQDLLSRSLDADILATLFSIAHVREDIVGRPVFEHLLTGTRLLLLLELSGVRRISIYGCNLFVNSRESVWFGHDLPMDLRVMLGVKRRLLQNGGSFHWEEEAQVLKGRAALHRAFKSGPSLVEPPVRAVPAGPTPGRKRAIVLNDTSLHYHYGCFATATALTDLLREDGYEVGTFPVTVTHGIKKTPANVSELCAEDFFQEFRACHPLLCQSMRAADLVVLNGEGTLHGNGAAPRNLLYLAMVARRHLGRPTYLVNHSLFPADKAAAAAAEQTEYYRLALAGLDGIAGREPLTLEILANLGIGAVQSFDMLPLFAHHAGVTAESEARDPGMVVVGIGVGWGAPLATQFALGLKNSLPASTRLLFLNGGPLKDPLEEQVCLPAMQQAHPRILSATPFADCLPTHRDHAREWLRHIARAGLVVTGRFHHAVAALALGTPVIALSSHTYKIEGALRLLGFEQEVLDPRAADFQQRLEEALAAFFTGGGQAVVTSASQRRRLCELALDNAVWRGRAG